MDFKFPLPPSTPAHSIAFSLDSPSFAEGLDIVAPLSLRAVNSHDPARNHPVFINSHLHPGDGSAHSAENYPVVRLHPACVGYFNHVEYETAMQSILQAQTMCDNSIGFTDFSTLSKAPKITIQRRRSSSIVSIFVSNSRARVIQEMAQRRQSFGGS
jgi:hypothetical protein